MSRAWYLICLIPVAIGGAATALLVAGMLGDVEAMQRVVVPGERELTLEAGEHIAYGESQSIVDGVSYSNTSFRARCALVAADGAQVPLASTNGSMSYALGSYQGQSMFEFTIASSGTYRLGCTGDDQPAVIAIGHGIGSGMVLGLVSGFGGVLVGVVLFFVIRAKRKRSLSPRE